MYLKSLKIFFKGWSYKVFKLKNDLNLIIDTHIKHALTKTGNNIEKLQF